MLIDNIIQYTCNLHCSISILVLCRQSIAIIHRLPCKEYGLFSVIKSEHSLSGSVLATFTNTDADACEYKCLQHAQCKSVNTNSQTKDCELNSKSTSDFLIGLNTLSSRAGWTYRSTNDSQVLIGENCENWNPCKRWHTCLDTCDCPGYHCVFIEPKDCQSLYQRGFRSSDVYQIQMTNEPIKSSVFCDMNTEHQGWIVFQRRVNDSVDFFLGWNDYKQGFGDLHGNFWLGLDKLHTLAAPGRGAILRVDMKHRTHGRKYAQYSKFEVGNETSGYLLAVGGYSGNAGDSLSYHNGMKFSTKDRDNDPQDDKHCAELYKGGWWYKRCHWSNLNSLLPPPTGSVQGKFLSWWTVDRQYGEIMFSEMKVKYN